MAIPYILLLISTSRNPTLVLETRKPREDKVIRIQNQEDQSNVPKAHAYPQ